MYNFKAFNMTLSWARIFPKGIKEGINPEGVEFYHNVFKECLKYNIVPFIIEDNLKMFYYRGLKEWNNERGYLVDTCLTAQDRYKSCLDYFRINY